MTPATPYKGRCPLTFQMSIIRLSHTTHCISITIDVHIIIYVLNRHSGLNITPANLYQFVQVWIKLSPCVTQHTLHPGEKRPQKSHKTNVQAGYKRQHKNNDNTKQGQHGTKSSAVMYQHNRVIWTAHLWFLEGRHPYGGISSEGKT